ncbi:hypothetical protein J8273_4578 [Carpediemonas membranifera]|uniref:Uncharacterized protein n=1 Tax=Carpediemonas membranifera TaxID=201153 RepID=A0A8J6B1Y2_9EUKA|nr:hypothetical protein J8273_4578 [Carpediemonas membranifera]|eukprot:KAG9393978.1 hypothetical protein J8273_4578 [Carpediemonas membranifera]
MWYRGITGAEFFREHLKNVPGFREQGISNMSNEEFTEWAVENFRPRFEWPAMPKRPPRKWVVLGQHKTREIPPEESVVTPVEKPAKTEFPLSQKPEASRSPAAMAIADDQTRQSTSKGYTAAEPNQAGPIFQEGADVARGTEATHAPQAAEIPSPAIEGTRQVEVTAAGPSPDVTQPSRRVPELKVSAQSTGPKDIDAAHLAADEVTLAGMLSNPESPRSPAAMAVTAETRQATPEVHKAAESGQTPRVFQADADLARGTGETPAVTSISRMQKVQSPAINGSGPVEVTAVGASPDDARPKSVPELTISTQSADYPDARDNDASHVAADEVTLTGKPSSPEEPRSPAAMAVTAAQTRQATPKVYSAIETNQTARVFQEGTAVVRGPEIRSPDVTSITRAAKVQSPALDSTRPVEVTAVGRLVTQPKRMPELKVSAHSTGPRDIDSYQQATDEVTLAGRLSSPEEPRSPAAMAVTAAQTRQATPKVYSAIETNQTARVFQEGTAVVRGPEIRSPDVTSITRAAKVQSPALDSTRPVEVTAVGRLVTQPKRMPELKVSARPVKAPTEETLHKSADEVTLTGKPAKTETPPRSTFRSPTTVRLAPLPTLAEPALSTSLSMSYALPPALMPSSAAPLEQSHDAPLPSMKMIPSEPSLEDSTDSLMDLVTRLSPKVVAAVPNPVVKPVVAAASQVPAMADSTPQPERRVAQSRIPTPRSVQRPVKPLPAAREARAPPPMATPVAKAISPNTERTPIAEPESPVQEMTASFEADGIVTDFLPGQSASDLAAKARSPLSPGEVFPLDHKRRKAHLDTLVKYYGEQSILSRSDESTLSNF